MRLAFCVHAHQPPGNFDWVFEAAVERSYRPFFTLLEQFPAMRISAHFSGSLLEWLEAHDPEFIALVRSQVERGQVELMAAGLYEPVLALLPVHDRANQLLAHRAYLRRLFGVDARVGWLTERVWEQPLAADLAHGGIEVVPLDDRHFLSAGVAPADVLHGPFVTEHQGVPLVVVPASEEMRHLIPWRPVPELVEALRTHAAAGTELLVFADDLEKFGLWPDTYEPIYDQGWLRDFFAAVTALETVEAVPLGEAVAGAPPARRVYIPDGSYPEMQRWTLFPEAQRRQAAVEEDLKHAGLSERATPFMRAGTYYQFLAKYPEVNWLHKRMLDLSERVARRYPPMQVARDPSHLPEAVRELWRAQANCAYWHGLFGGAYLPHLRQALWHHLLRAEAVLETAGARRQPLRVFDLDADLRDEALLTGDHLVVGVAPADGGAVVELSERGHAFNLVDTLARRVEAYHGQGDEAPYGDDRGRRACFVDRFLAPGSLAADEEPRDRGDFAGRPYELRALRRTGTSTITLTRAASAPGGEARVRKDIMFAHAGHTLRARYRVAGVEGNVRARFGIEQNFGVFAADDDDAGYDLGAGLRPLREASRAEHASTLEVRLAQPLLCVAVHADPPADVAVRAITTTSQSEAGAEWIPQSLSALFTWPVALAPGDTFAAAIEMEVSTG